MMMIDGVMVRPYIQKILELVTGVLIAVISFCSLRSSEREEYEKKYKGGGERYSSTCRYYRVNSN